MTELSVSFFETEFYTTSDPPVNLLSLGNLLLELVISCCGTCCRNSGHGGVRRGGGLVEFEKEHPNVRCFFTSIQYYGLSV